MGTSWRNRPIYFGLFVGGILADDPIEGRVQHRAARIVVVVVLPAEAFLVKENAIDRLDDALDIARASEMAAGGGGPPIDLFEIVMDVEARLIFQSDHERGFHEIQERLRALRNFTEALARQGGMSEDSSRLHFVKPPSFVSTSPFDETHP